MEYKVGFEHGNVLSHAWIAYTEMISPKFWRFAVFRAMEFFLLNFQPKPLLGYCSSHPRFQLDCGVSTKAVKYDLDIDGSVRHILYFLFSYWRLLNVVPS